MCGLRECIYYFNARKEGKRRRGRQRMRWLYNVTNSMDMNLSKLSDIVKDREVWHATVHGISKCPTNLVTEQ